MMWLQSKRFLLSDSNMQSRRAFLLRIYNKCRYVTLSCLYSFSATVNLCDFGAAIVIIAKCTCKGYVRLLSVTLRYNRLVTLRFVTSVGQIAMLLTNPPNTCS